MAFNSRPLFDACAASKTPERIAFDELMLFAEHLKKDFPVLERTQIILKATKRGYAYIQEEFIPRRIYIPSHYLWTYPLLTSKILLVHELCHQILGMPKDKKEIHGKEFQEKETELMAKYFGLKPIYAVKDAFGTIGYCTELVSLDTGEIYSKWQHKRK